jgi:hypothetical protein
LPQLRCRKNTLADQLVDRADADAEPGRGRVGADRDMDFAIRCPLVRRWRLVSGFCSSARTFVPRFQGRARIEQAVAKLKRFRRIALRCEKTAQNFAAFVSLVCAFILVKSVHTA